MLKTVEICFLGYFHLNMGIVSGFAKIKISRFPVKFQRRPMCTRFQPPKSATMLFGQLNKALAYKNMLNLIRKASGFFRKLWRSYLIVIVSISKVRLTGKSRKRLILTWWVKYILSCSFKSNIRNFQRYSEIRIEDMRILTKHAVFH